MNSAVRHNILHQNPDFWLLLGCIVGMGGSLYFDLSPLLRWFFSLPMVFYAPGYAFMCALYPSNEHIHAGQRWTASLGLSLVISSLVGLVVSYSVGTTLNTSFMALSFWVLVMLLIAGYRRARLSSSERYWPSFKSLLPAWRQTGRWQKVLTSTQVFALGLLCLAGIRLFQMALSTEPQFTEFYLLGQDGQADRYPQSAALNEPVMVTAGVVNQQGQNIHYGLAYQVDASKTRLLQDFWLVADERWQQEVSLAMPDSPGIHKVALLLWDMESGQSLDTLYLWIEVSSPPE
jgi:uncharacterized membrane protein